MTIDTERNRLEWVNALRSGEYVQGHFKLKQIDGDGEVEHCPWGVACEIYKTHNPGCCEWSEYSEDDWRSSAFLCKDYNLDDNYTFQSDYHQYPPKRVIEYFIGDLENIYSGTIIAFNDESEFSFNEIADCIENDTVPENYRHNIPYEIEGEFYEST